MEIAIKARSHWGTCTFKVYFDIFAVGTSFLKIHSKGIMAAEIGIQNGLLIV